MVHLAPAVAAPLAPGHVDHEVALVLLVVDAAVGAVAAGARRERVDAALRDECHARPDPGLVGVEVLEAVLLLVLPFHVLLLVEDRVPPDVEKAVGPGGAADEKGTEVEAGAVLRDDQVDRGGVLVAVDCAGQGVEVRRIERVGDVEGVVDIDVAVGEGAKVVENVVFKRVRVLHDVGVEVEPPEPVSQSAICHRPKKKWLITYHSASGYLRIQSRMMSTFSQLSRHSWEYRFFVIMLVISR